MVESAGQYVLQDHRVDRSAVATVKVLERHGFEKCRFPGARFPYDVDVGKSDLRS
jgi:hypothetical protein